MNNQLKNLQEEGREQTLRLEIYSVKGSFKGSCRYFVDIPFGIAGQVIAFCLPHGKKVKGAKYE